MKASLKGLVSGKQTAFLLGAGASIPAGIPGSFSMTRVLQEQVIKRRPSLSHPLRFVIGGLQFQAGVSNKNPLEGIDVEDLLSAINLLADRHSLEAAPFIAQWHQMVERLDDSTADARRNVLEELFAQLTQEIMGMIAEAAPRRPPYGIGTADLRRALSSDGSPRLSARDLERYVSEWLMSWAKGLRDQRTSHWEHAALASEAIESVSRQGEGEIYRELAAEMTSALAGVAWVTEPAAVQYLLPLVNYAQRQPFQMIATLNYDNTVELCCQQLGSKPYRGLKDWSEGKPIEAQRERLSLLKLHGSVDWSLTQSRPTSDSPLPMPRISIAQPASERGRYDPAIIFGGRNKLTASGPFLELLAGFGRGLEQANHLVVIGYSFRDDHVNQLIIRWLNAKTERNLTIVDPGVEQSEVEFCRRLLSLRSSGRATLLAEQAQDALGTLL